ncbi:GlxA family transcriptional regulator [Streptomyces agglomeratus]|uniref:GlxA family transcriptional regulator n=1 Tax=Streptomyces agglomeratus TaxID=285458 RepID=UPI00099FDB93|nr:helix-turn-helix domain-containing protein [Streptomyces agglomeratus]
MPLDPPTPPPAPAPPAPAFSSPDGRHRVAVLVRDGLLTMELGIVHRLFGQAVSAAGVPLYEVLTCTPEPGDVRTDADVTVRVTHGTDILAEADTVIVPASDEDYTPRTAPHLPPALAKALAGIRPDARIASICTGSFVLAAAGLLDGKRATTHWRSAADLQRLHPEVRVDPDVLYTDEDGVVTAAGVASGIDLCLHMIRSDHGSRVANEVARGTVVPPHRDGGQAQYIPRPVTAPRQSSTEPARTWALEHLDRPISLREFAGRAAMSTRTFSRRFCEEAGQTPVQWLTRQRVDRARQLLEETDLPVDRVAAAAGFGTAVSLRQHLHAALGVSPSAYRSTFRGAAAPGEPGEAGRVAREATATDADGRRPA